MIHIDRGGDRRGTQEFFDRLKSYNVEYDVIGQSYYPWWHGSLLDLRDNLAFMSSEYQKDIILVEVAYCCAPRRVSQATRSIPRNSRRPTSIP